METWHATAKTLPHAHFSIWRLQGFGVRFRGGASGWGFGVGFRGFGVGVRGGVVMPCAQHGNVARYSKDTSTCTLLYLETSGFRGGASGWGFEVSGWGRDAVRSAWKRGTPQQGLMECETNTQNKPGMPWRKWVAIHNFVASAFLRYKISTQKCFRTLQLCQCPWNVKSTLKTNLDRLGENWLLSTTS